MFQANSSPLCNTILDVMSSIYHQDNANYFILESQHTLPQFAEKIYLKSQDVQVSLSLTAALATKGWGAKWGRRGGGVLVVAY